MADINSKYKLSNIKKAKDEISAFNRWQGTARIMYDISDGDLWTDVFASENEWKNYHSDDIVCIYSKNSIIERNNKVSLEKIQVGLDDYVRAGFMR